MSTVQNRTQFERAIERMIRDADKQNRGPDLDRVVRHLEETPATVSRLASLMMLVDEDVRADLSAAVESFRRFGAQKGNAPKDDELLDILRGVYERVRG